MARLPDIARRRPKREFDAVFYAPFVGPMLASRLDPSSPPTTGGAERQVFLVSRALAERGWRVGIIVYDSGGSLPSAVEGVDLITQARVRGGRSVAARALDYIRYLANFRRVITAVDSYAFVQRAAGVETGLVALTAKARRRRFVYSSANVVDFEYSRLEHNRVKRVLFSSGIRLADMVVVQTAEQERMYAERSARPAITIHSIAEVIEHGERRPDAFIWVGRPAPYKNPMAFVELARRLPEVPFRMVGLGRATDGHSLAAQVAVAAGNLPNLELIPAVPHDVLGGLFDRAVAVVNTAEYEGMPNVLLEAWARGVPALVLQHDPDGVIEREGLGAFAHGSPDALARQALDLWHRRDRQAEVGERCRSYIRRTHGAPVAVGRWEVALGLDRAAR